MQRATETVVGQGSVHEHGEEIPTADTVIVTANTRAAVVAKFRELADRLESGELTGASVQWNDDPSMPAMVYVERLPDAVRLVRTTFERPLRVVGEEK